MAETDKSKAHWVTAADVPSRTGTFYPAHLKSASENRIKRALGDAVGLTRFGVNHTILPPGSASALRHWHRNEDEFVYVLEGEAVLITNSGETVLSAGMAAGFPAGAADGHKIENRSPADVVILEVGNRVEEDEVTYPDDDLVLVKEPGARRYLDKAGNELSSVNTG